MRSRWRGAAQLGALMVWALAGAARGQPPVWIVHGPRSTMVLFGSVHLLPLGLDWRPVALNEALALSRAVWFELPIDDATDATARRLARARGFYPKGDTLAAHLTAPEAARLDRDAVAVGVSPAVLAPMRPWLAEVTLSLAADTRAGARASQGVEVQVQGIAPDSARRETFETAAQQIGFLAGADPRDQVASLTTTLEEIETRPDAYSRLVAAWMSGDAAAMEAQALEPLRRAAPGLYRRLIVERNRRWAGILRRQLAKPGTSVVVVGVGHLIGTDGVPALLRASGFKVDGP